MNYLENCVFVDESAFDINMRPPSGWSLRGMPAGTVTPTTRAESYTILGAISSRFVVCVELRDPQAETSKRIKIDYSGRKRKAPAEIEKKPKGTVTGHYMKFLEKIMDGMDQSPELQGHYIVMDNAPIHTANHINEMITAGG